MAIIKGILKSPTGELMAGAYIALVSKKNTDNMLRGLESEFVTGSDGSYYFDCPAGYYDVFVRSCESKAVYCGYIYVINTDKDGTLNTLLIRELPADIDKDLVEKVLDYSNRAIAAANKSEQWADSDIEIEPGKYSARHWAQTAQISGVESFNGRKDKVIPTDGDYSVEQVTNAASISFVNEVASKLATNDSLEESLKNKADINSPTFTGEPRIDVAPALSDNSRRLCSTGWVQGNLSNKVTTASLNSALAFKANIVSPVLTGQPKAPTQSTGDNSTSIATTEFVSSAINAIPKPAAFRIENNASFVLPNATDLTFSSTKTIFLDGFDYSGATNFKVKTSGLYCIGAGFTCTAPYSGAVITEPKNINFLVNGVTRIFSETHGAQNSDGRGAWRASGLMSLLAGDVVSIKINQWSQQPMTITVHSGNYFEGFLIRSNS